MQISKITFQNNSFGFKIGTKLEQHFKSTAGKLNKVAEGNLLTAIIDGHKDNTEFIRNICPDKTIELVYEDTTNGIRKYQIFDSNNKCIFSINTEKDNLWYAKLVKKLKEFRKL